MFRVRLSCRDCTGIDPMGCFDGGTAFVIDTKAPWARLTFATIDEAKEIGWDRVINVGPYEFDVLNEDDEIVFSSSST